MNQEKMTTKQKEQTQQGFTLCFLTETVTDTTKKAPKANRWGFSLKIKRVEAL